MTKTPLYPHLFSAQNLAGSTTPPPQSQRSELRKNFERRSPSTFYTISPLYLLTL
jgi:hypothetical protein